MQFSSLNRKAIQMQTLVKQFLNSLQTICKQLLKKSQKDVGPTFFIKNLYDKDM